MLIELLAKTPQMRSLIPGEADVAMALRFWVALKKIDRCPMQAVAQRLGSMRAAAHLHLMMEEIGAAWPEPFRVSPPCCASLTPDEATVVEMMRLGQRGDRPAFDRLLGEMLCDDMRDRLFLSASVLSRAMRG